MEQAHSLIAPSPENICTCQQGIPETHIDLQTNSWETLHPRVCSPAQDVMLNAGGGTVTSSVMLL